jgi:transposase
MLWKLATGVPWRDLPARYGPWQTCYERFGRWQADGTWQRLLAHAQTRSDAVGEVDWEVVWSTRPSSGPTSTPPGPEKGTVQLPRSAAEVDQALGRSRGGRTTKVHLAADGRGRPLAMVVTAGQRHESTQLEPLLDAIRVPRSGPGRPRKRPTHLIADRGYSYTTCRRLLRQRRIAHTIPERSDQQQLRARRGARGGRPPVVDPVRYRHRNVVERTIARLKQHRAIATRYDKLAVSYHSWLVLAALLLWLPT